MWSQILGDHRAKITIIGCIATIHFGFICTEISMYCDYIMQGTQEVYLAAGSIEVRILIDPLSQPAGARIHE